MKLTVVVSCYKQEKYIGPCLESILSQQTDFDFDIVIADDYSPDGTRVVIADYHRRFPERIKLVFQEHNVGAARNYFAGHNAAQGEYVAHFDGDDVMLPGKLQAQVDVLESNAACNVVMHRARYFSDDRLYLADTGPLFTNGKTVMFNRADFARWGTIAIHSSYMYRRSSRTTRVYSADFMEWFFAYESLMNGGLGAYINEIYAEYRCNPNGNAYTSSSAGREKAYLIIIGHVADDFAAGGPKTDLYAHMLVNVMMYCKSLRKIRWPMASFLLRNVLQFRPGKLLDTMRVRRMVGPSKKIR